ncbi:MAG: ATP-binding cassette domain-containing protein [Bacteroidota bacterium]|nr:ATP-binding cassette domain-containing protein [Bacteroidota bacterium]MDP4232185.1 ATP-binding cassette domain-containing protein [Bacteroidota bacterium]MDP4241107.1 ATP-binding cassette domain-containing protein [Bacteroidota bacterium]MDP4286499.1 ATP-binding cassette domain-containing protein [Bacteroidota bacterium]
MKVENPIIEVCELRKIFRAKQKQAGLRGSLRSLVHPEFREIEAVGSAMMGGMNFECQTGERIAFIGPNGAGKSTTIKMLTGILLPTSGSIRCAGLDPSRERKQLAHSIGTVFGQKSQLWYHLPAIDTYELFSRIYELPRAAYRERLDYLVAAFDIGAMLETPVRKLSLGERMRCEIVASLLHRPSILFLDEPTIGLDVVAKLGIREVIRDLNEQEGVTIFLTSHDAGDVESLAERTMVVNHGRLMFDGPTASFRAQFISTKTIELHLDEDASAFDFREGAVTQRSKHSITIELPAGAGVSSEPIERLLAYTVENFTLKDVNIFEPPMEEIIRRMYQDHPSPTHGWMENHVATPPLIS